jgi:hypothetical protein
MTRFLREIAAICLHRLADRLIAAALGLQKLGFRAEFGSEWRVVREQHYRQSLTQAHFKAAQQ